MTNGIHKDEDADSERIIASAQKQALFTELTSSIGFQYLAVYPACTSKREDLGKRIRENTGIRVQLEKIRHSKLRKSMVPLRVKSGFLVFFPQGSFAFTATSSFTLDDRAKDCYVEPAIWGKTYLGALRYELRPNVDERNSKDFPFIFKETLVDATGKVVHCLRTAVLAEKSDTQARKAFEKFIQNFETEYNPLLELSAAEEDVSKAHLDVCKDIFRKTMSYLRDYEESDSVEEGQRLLNLAKKEFALERQSHQKHGDSPDSKRMCRNARRRVQKYNSVDREIVANWEKCYQFMDGATFARLVREATGINVKPKVLRRRQQRLGLVTNASVPTGPKPKS